MSKASANPIRSMTGFARARRMTPRGELILSLRGVNHRGLDMHFYLGADLEPFEGALRKAISAAVIRGHVDIRAQITPVRDAGAAAWNKPLMEAWLAAFRQAAKEYGLSGEPDLNTAFRIPGMLSSAATDEPGPETEATLLEMADEALREFNAHRDQEGASTAEVLRGHAAKIREAAAEMESIRGAIVPALHARIQERLRELLQGASLDPARLAQEAALLADRSDIGEEVTRLKIHTARLSELLDAGGEVGKKLDFLLQEMQRESNTILSKSNAAGEGGRRLTELGLAVKSEIEKIREQALNLE